MNAECNNTQGSYNCTCKDGFHGNGTNCTGQYFLDNLGSVVFFYEVTSYSEININRLNWHKQDKIIEVRFSVLIMIYCNNIDTIKIFSSLPRNSETLVLVKVCSILFCLLLAFDYVTFCIIHVVPCAMQHSIHIRQGNCCVIHLITTWQCSSVVDRNFHTATT